jgi:hypothetical protein
MSALPADVEQAFLRKLTAAALRPLTDIRKQDPCGCNAALSDAALASLYCYTTEDANYSYRTINRDLSAGASSSAEVKTQISYIDAALDSLPAHTGECYRSEEADGRIHSKAKRLITLPTPPTVDDVTELFVEFFMSTSLDRALALRGSDVEIVVAGTSAGRHISHISQFPNEKEILFKRDTRFLILEVDQTPSSFLIYLGEI